MKERMAIPIIFSWSAAFSSSWATLLVQPGDSQQKSLLISLLNIVSELAEHIPELHHVVRDRVEVLEGAVDVTGALVQVQGVP